MALTANQFHILIAIADGNTTRDAISNAVYMSRHQTETYLHRMYSEGWLTRPEKDKWELSYNGEFELANLLKSIK